MNGNNILFYLFMYTVRAGVYSHDGLDLLVIMFIMCTCVYHERGKDFS